MIKKNTKIIALGIISTLLAAFLIGTLAQAKSSPVNETQKSKLEAYIKFTQILNLISQQYVDETNTTALVDKALKGLLSNLDAHSSYLDTKSFKELNVQTAGEFGGLGITVGMRDGALSVIAPLANTPADKAGVLAGDIILKIDDQATLGMTIDEAVGLMRGKPGTDIVLTLVRKNESKPLRVKITRDIIEIQSVFTKTIDENILYIHITSFDQKVVDDVKAAIAKDANRTGYLIDLRNNPGGLLDQAVGVVDLFVDEGLIVTQKGRDAAENVAFRATQKDSDTQTPIVVLVNPGSASASEIVSGALQDHGRAVIVGEKTFGKGSVQVVMPIGDGEALRLTVARYYLPQGRTIQAVGVTPDILVKPCKLSCDDNNTLMIKEADLAKHLQNELEKIDGAASETNTTTPEDTNRTITPEQIRRDTQLKTAVDILKAMMLTSQPKAVHGQN
jgi:carboxyl-terminal processing protease